MKIKVEALRQIIREEIKDRSQRRPEDDVETPELPWEKALRTPATRPKKLSLKELMASVGDESIV